MSSWVNSTTRHTTTKKKTIEEQQSYLNPSIPATAMARGDYVQDLKVTEQTRSRNSLHGDALTLADKLRGRIFHIPAMWDIFSDWPVARNSHLKAIQSYADMTLEKHISCQKKLRTLKESDMGGLVAL